MEELKLIRQLHRSLYNKDLLNLINNTRKNNEFARAVYLRLSEPNERDAEILRNAVFGPSVNLGTVVEILCSRPSLELHSVKQVYLSRYNSDIEQDLALKINGGFKEILIAVLKSSRCSNSKVNMSMAMCDAKTIYEAMESGKCVDQKTIISLMSQRSNGQLKSILVSYKQLYGHEFSKSLKRNKCGQFGKELRTVIRCIQYPDKYFAKKLRKTTNNTDIREVLIRTIITRSGIDIKDINHAYTSKSGCSLESQVRRKFEETLAEFLIELLKCC
ncbi:Annexin [Macleaya cordata]|uniref:Annexin n=1 Tax=Macleaya cordata TaxID=56857 RepID=A0A200PY16_MACCD|nr:Annexin [Macleaya cordata]